MNSLALSMGPNLVLHYAVDSGLKGIYFYASSKKSKNKNIF